MSSPEQPTPGQPMFRFVKPLQARPARRVLRLFASTPSAGSSSPSATAGWTRETTTRTLLIIFAFWLVTALVWPVTGAVVPWDSKNHFYPMLRYLGASLEAGEWPLWNPYHFSGYPSVADPQSLLFTPSMVLFGWLLPRASMQLFDIAVYAHFLLGAVGIVGLFKRRGWHPAGAIVTVMIYILGGSASARLQHTGMIFSYGYFPLALFLLESSLARRSYVRAIAFGIVASLMALGRDQVAYLFCLALIGSVGYQVFAASAPLTYLRSRIGLLAVMAVTGAALLAIPALLTIQFLSDSNRPMIDFATAGMGSLPPQSLATAIFGNIFGSLNLTYDYWGPGPHTLPEGTWTDRAIDYLFIGTVPAMLILWHGIGGGRLLAREFRFFLYVGIGALIYALGYYTPVFELFYRYIPGVDLYRRPADATFMLNFAFAMAAGYLVHRFMAEGAPKRADVERHPASPLLVVLAVGLTAAAIINASRFAIAAGKLPEAMTQIGLGALVALIAAAVIIAGRKPALRLYACAALVAITGGDLILRNAASALNAEPRDRYAVFEQLPADQLRGLQVLTRELAARHAEGARPRVEILGLQGAWQNASMVLGLEDTLGYNPLRIADYERAVGPGENAADASLRQFPITFRNYRSRLASLLGLEYIVLDRPVEKMPSQFPHLPQARLIYGAGTMWIYKMPPRTPRAYLATRLVPVESERVLKEQGLPDLEHSDEALIDVADVKDLDNRYGLGDSTETLEPPSGKAIIIRYRRNSVRIRVVADKPAMLVLHDIYYPGWQVTVDGEEKPIRRANLLFRAVEVPAGRHMVEFSYQPLSLHNLATAAADLLDDKETAAVK
ncbi:YfhO family protein [Chelatococcus asaccharovorans]|nr:YfhO family protein [Chelatococcus asaccharovorans]